MSDFTIGQHVKVGPTGDYPKDDRSGTVREIHRNPSGDLNGIIRITLDTPTDRAGRTIDVGTRTIDVGTRV